MIRILQVYPQLNNAGTEMVMMNWYKNIDKNKVQFDFLVQKHGELDEIVESMGARVFVQPLTNDYKNNLLSFFKEHNEYNTVHTHTHKEMGVALEMAKKAGIKNRIAHSHNSRTDLPAIFKIYKMITSRKTEANATYFMSCSKEAAKWQFPRKYHQCQIVNNAIDLEKFLFNEECRTAFRNQFNLYENDKVICHVGRFAEQKNHKRIIKIINEMMKNDEKLHAFLIGVGPLLEQIKSEAKYDRIHFLGNRTDVPDIMCASDLFLFPSLYEGLGIVAVEAQASGLHCIASDNVPKAADIGNNLFHQLSLNDSDEKWIQTINKYIVPVKDRKEKSLSSFNTDYNIKKIANQMENFYLEIN